MLPKQQPGGLQVLQAFFGSLRIWVRVTRGHCWPLELQLAQTGALEVPWEALAAEQSLGDVPGLGDISPLSCSARLVSMQDTLPKAHH